MDERHICKQVVVQSLLDSEPKIKDDIIASNRMKIAYELVRIIGDNEVHSIQLIESQESMQDVVSFIAELIIFR